LGLYIIRNTNRQKQLLQTDQRIFKTSDLAILWDEQNRNTLIKTIQRYIERGILSRIYKGLYSTLPIEDLDKYEVGCAIGGAFSYISAETVLAQKGIIFQDIKKITLFGRREKEITLAGTTYLCRYLNDKYLLNRSGIEDKERYSVATAERALADVRHINSRFFIDNELSINQKKVNNLNEEIGYHDSLQ
jgi:predicted transcriptional regulator of viral defense system